jgi:hypothetical protein
MTRTELEKVLPPNSSLNTDAQQKIAASGLVLGTC